MVTTSEILTADEVGQLNDAYDVALSRDQEAVGAWADVYELLYGFITTSVIGVVDLIDTPRTDVAVDPGTWLWLKGARFVNAGEGAMRRDGRPMLVTFGDEADPMSIEKVDPQNLAANFGEGVSLKRITVQATDAPVTTGIEKRLEWMEHYRRKWLNWQSSFVQDLTTAELTARLSAGSFSTDFAQ